MADSREALSRQIRGIQVLCWTLERTQASNVAAVAREAMEDPPDAVAGDTTLAAVRARRVFGRRTSLQPVVLAGKIWVEVEVQGAVPEGQLMVAVSSFLDRHPDPAG